jgi:hypothetical protein
MNPTGSLTTSTETSDRCLWFIPNPWNEVHHVHELKSSATDYSNRYH